MEKILSIVIPVYNTEQYLNKCLDSIIVEGKMHLFEALVIIDGSPDNSAQIAKQYQERYPDTFKVIEKENGGHSSAINTGFELATGKYFKLLDSDDWFDTDAFSILLDKLKTTNVDILFTNFVYEYVFENRQEKHELIGVAENKVFDFCDVNNNPNKSNLLSVHTMIYKLELLRKINLELPPKVFYGDTYLVITPVFSAESLEYLNVDLYRYFIGREGQSVSPEVFLKRRNDLIIVLKEIIRLFLIHERNINKCNCQLIYFYLSTRLLIIFEVLERLKYSQRVNERKLWREYVLNLPFYNEMKNKYFIIYLNYPYFVRRVIFKMIFIKNNVLKPFFRKNK